MVLWGLCQRLDRASAEGGGGGDNTEEVYNNAMLGRHSPADHSNQCFGAFYPFHSIPATAVSTVPRGWVPSLQPKEQVLPNKYVFWAPPILDIKGKVPTLAITIPGAPYDHAKFHRKRSASLRGNAPRRTQTDTSRPYIRCDSTKGCLSESVIVMPSSLCSACVLVSCIQILRRAL